MPGLGKPRRTHLTIKSPRRLQIGDAGFLGDGSGGWMARLPTDLCSQGTPFPTPKKTAAVLSEEGEPEALWGRRAPPY